MGTETFNYSLLIALGGYNDHFHYSVIFDQEFCVSLSTVAGTISVRTH